jgi:hypothetical protein
VLLIPAGTPHWFTIRPARKDNFTPPELAWDRTATVCR